MHNLVTGLCTYYGVGLTIISYSVMARYASWQNLFHIPDNYIECVQLCHEWRIAVTPNMYNRFIAASAMII